MFFVFVLSLYFLQITSKTLFTDDDDDDEDDNSQSLAALIAAKTEPKNLGRCI